jgi:hypothetical protein
MLILEGKFYFDVLGAIKLISLLSKKSKHDIRKTVD